MALNASGPISLAGSTVGQSIALELGQSATGVISLNDTAVRGLAGVSSGAITMPTSFWGKSNTAISDFGMTVAKQAYLENIVFGNGYIISGGPGNFMSYSTDNGATWANVKFPINYSLSKAYVDTSAWYLVIYVSTSSSGGNKIFRCPFSSSLTVVSNWTEVVNFATSNELYYLVYINNVWLTASNGYVTNLKYKTSYSGTFANCTLPTMVAYYPGVASYYGLTFAQGGNSTSFAYNGSIILTLGTYFNGTNTTYYVLTSSDNGVSWTETSTGLVLSGGANVLVQNVVWDATSNLFYATAQNTTSGLAIFLVSTSSSGTSWNQYTGGTYGDSFQMFTNSGGTPYYVYNPSRINRAVANTTPATSVVFDLIKGYGAFVKTGSNIVTSGTSVAYTSSFSAASGTWAQSTTGQQYTYDSNYWTNAGLTLTSSSLGHFAVYGGYANPSGGLNAENGVHFSSNNGASWTSTSLGGGAVDLYSIAASNSAIVVTTNGGLTFRSTNGTSWSSTYLSVGGYIVGLGGSSGVMVVFGSSSNNYHYTTNSGASWSSGSFGGTYQLRGGCVTGTDITLFSVNSSGVVYYHKSSNGSSWTTNTVNGVPANADIQGGAVSIASTSVVTLLTFSYGFKIWVSTDGGLNFTQYNTNGGYGNFVQQLGYGSMTLCADGSAYVGVATSASGYGNALYKSTNGITYTEYSLGTANTSFFLAGAVYKSGQTASLTNNNYVISYKFSGYKPTSVGYLSS